MTTILLTLGLLGVGGVWAAPPAPPVGPPAPPAKKLLQELNSPDPAVREEALTAVTAEDLDDAELTQAVLMRATDADSWVRLEAIGALRRQQWPIDSPLRARAITVLGLRLTDSEPDVRQFAAFALQTNGEIADERIVKRLIAMLADPSYLLRMAAARTLGTAAAPGHQEVLAALRPLVADPSFAVRQNLAWSLARLSDDSDESVAFLTRLRRDDVATSEASQALIQVAVRHRSEKLLRRLTQDTQAAVRFDLVESLRGLSDTDDGGRRLVVSCLRTLLRDADPGVRFHAMRNMDDFGVTARAAHPELLALLTDRDGYAQAGGLTGLAGSGGGYAQAVPTLVRLMTNPSMATRELTAIALGKLGRDAGPAVAELTKNLSAPSWRVLYQCLFALAAVGPDAVADSAELLMLVDDLRQQDPCEQVRTQAETTLAAVRAKG